MKKKQWIIVKNAGANLVRGGATALVALLLPHFMAKNLDADRFAAWSLMLQIAAYASFLDFGLQAAIARYVAQAVELQQGDRARSVFGTAALMLSVAAALAGVTAAIVLYFAGSIFHGIPQSLLQEFRVGAAVMAGAAVLQLPFSAYSGFLIGLQRNDIPALAIGGSRIFGAVAAVVASQRTHSLALLALCIGVPNVMGGLLQVVAKEKIEPLKTGQKRFPMDRAQASELLRYCAGLTVWSFSMLLITGLDVTIVGHFDFIATGPYAIAAALTSLQANANSLILSAFLAPFAAMHAQGKLAQVRSIVVRSTRINTWMNLVVLAATLGMGMTVLRVWVGGSYAAKAYPILIALMVSQSIRLSWTSYSIALMATDHQNDCIVSAIVEGVVNLGVSLWAVRRFGAIGVAVGSIAGALAAIPVLVWLTIYSRPDLPISRRDLLWTGVARALAAASPLLLCGMLQSAGILHGSSIPIAWAATAAVSALLARRLAFRTLALE